VIKYIRSAIAADGLITRFAPRFNVGRHLEEVCQRWVSWEARRMAWSSDTFAGWLAAGSHLAQSGPARAATILRHVVDGDMGARVELRTSADPGARARRRTIRLAGMVVALTALVELTGGNATVGLNLFTAESMLVVAALMMLGESIRRLSLAG
jgi:hypothetical protein